LDILVETLGSMDAVVSTTGFMSRELYEIRVKNRDTHEKDFLTVGSMGQ
jgi:phosphonopyruvate decarboxylase